VLALEAVPGRSGVRVLDNEGDRSRSRNPPGEVGAGEVGTLSEDIEDRAVSVSFSEGGCGQDVSAPRCGIVAENGGSGKAPASVV